MSFWGNVPDCISSTADVEQCRVCADGVVSPRCHRQTLGWNATMEVQSGSQAHYCPPLYKAYTTWIKKSDLRRQLIQPNCAPAGIYGIRSINRLHKQNTKMAKWYVRKTVNINTGCVGSRSELSKPFSLHVYIYMWNYL